MTLPNLTNQELLQEIKKFLTEDTAEDTQEVQKLEPLPFTTTVPLISHQTLLKWGLMAAIVLLTLHFTKITISGTISGIELVKNQP